MVTLSKFKISIQGVSKVKKLQFHDIFRIATTLYQVTGTARRYQSGWSGFNLTTFQ